MNTKSLTSSSRNVTANPLHLLVEIPTFSLEDCHFRVIESVARVLQGLGRKEQVFLDLLRRYRGSEGWAELPTPLSCAIEEGVWDAQIERLLKEGAIALRSVAQRDRDVGICPQEQ